LGFSAILVRNIQAARWYQPGRAAATGLLAISALRRAQERALEVHSCALELVHVSQPHSTRDEIADEELALRI
jgi:hypothetical protein